MPRPRKCRRVCDLPANTSFGSFNTTPSAENTITMTVEEYETIRLIDFEKLTQEACASQMNVARTTIQRIYNDARYKLAQVLVDGKLLKIEGGNYQLCEQKQATCPKRHCGHAGCKWGSTKIKE